MSKQYEAQCMAARNTERWFNRMLSQPIDPKVKAMLAKAFISFQDNYKEFLLA